MLSVIKYLAWFLTNGLAVSGVWFVKFTEDTPEGRKKLTKWGKIGLPITIVSCLLALALTIAADIKEAKQAKLKTDEVAELNIKMGKILDLVSVLGQPESAARRTQFEEILEDPVIKEIASENPGLRQALQQIDSRIGGKPQLISRLETIDPNLKLTPESIAVFASFSLKQYGPETTPETHEGIVKTIRGIEADVIALQEIRDVTALNRLLTSLPEFESISFLSDHLMNPILLLRKHRVVRIGATDSINGPFARRPLVQKVQMGNSLITFVNVHLKSRFSSPADPQGMNRRTAEIEAIATWIRDQKPNESIVLMGVFQTGLNEPEMKTLHELGVLFPTRELPANSTSYISRDSSFGPIVMSHFGLVGPIKQNYITRSIQIYDLVKLLPEMDKREIVESISDHNPISITVQRTN